MEKNGEKIKKLRKNEKNGKIERENTKLKKSNKNEESIFFIFF